MGTGYTLLSRGYFPAELPPPFGTQKFAESVEATGLFREPSGQKTEFCRHNLARSGRLRRELSIPNPRWHVPLCRVLESNWVAVESKFAASMLSMSKPASHKRRAFQTEFTQAQLRDRRAKAWPSNRFVARCDISQFYPSIYTHALTWAFHTKTVAKKNKFNKQYFGNDIDLYLRNAQDGQTIGIPIGPDSSLILAESLLSNVDAKVYPLVRRPWQGFRYVDDYEVAFSTLKDADRFVADLAGYLGEYELDLNPSKATVTDMPSTLDPGWVSALRHLPAMRYTTRGQATDLVTLFTRAFELFPAHQDKGIMKYACGWLWRTPLIEKNWELALSLLLTAATRDAGALSKVAGTICTYLKAGYSIDRALLGDTLDDIIRRHAPLGHGSEVAWALWLAICAEVDLDTAAVSALERMEDSVVAIVALDARARGRIPSTFSPAVWQSAQQEGLYGPHWLLAYEATQKGWLSSTSIDAQFNADVDYNQLRADNVEFYEILHDPVSATESSLRLKSDLDGEPGDSWSI